MAPPPSASSSSSMLPPPTTPVCTSAFLLSSSGSTSNAMDFRGSGYRSSTSNSELTSASCGKCKYSALGDGDPSRKHSRPPSIAAMAQQEGSAALMAIVQSLPHVMSSLTSTTASQLSAPLLLPLGIVMNWGGVTSNKDKVKVQGTRSEYDQGSSLKDESKRFLRE
ncbi:hypothetical protein BDR07DRAFT_1482715 [Suillus spraguei]|nr:hypothetical protein BDR07DRAFT_1482715 [Suillus spraguei]